MKTQLLRIKNNIKVHKAKTKYIKQQNELGWKLHKANKAWQKKNAHNFSTIENIFNQKIVSVGKGTYGPLLVYSACDKNHLSIGNYCSIAEGVQFLLCLDHPTNLISTYPFKVKYMNEKYEAISKGDIIIDDDVWIGSRATILSGVHIGQGAIIATGAIVDKDIPPYAIACGVPAKVKKYRFSDEIIKKMLQIDFGKIDEYEIEGNIDILYQPVDDNTQIDALPQKSVDLEK